MRNKRLIAKLAISLFCLTILRKGVRDMFKLGKDSIVVQTWFSAVINNMVTIDKVPAIFGIKEAVEELLKEMQGKKEA